MNKVDYMSYSSAELEQQLPAIVYDMLAQNTKYHAEEALARIVEDYWLDDADKTITFQLQNSQTYKLNFQVVQVASPIDRLHALKVQYLNGDLANVDLPDLLSLAKQCNQINLATEVEEAIHNLKHEDDEE